jgi:hypothetical protein
MKRYLAILALLPLLAMGGRQQGMGPGPGMPASAGGGGGTASYVQSCGYNLNNSTSQTSIACSLTSVAAGDLITVCSTWLTSSQTITVSDGTSTLTNGSAAYDGYSGNTFYGQCAYLLAANSGNKTYTVTFSSGSVYEVIWVEEFHTTSGTWHYATAPSPQVGGYLSPATTNTFTTTGTNQVITMGWEYAYVGASPSGASIGGNTPTLDSTASSAIGSSQNKYYLLNIPVTGGSGSVTFTGSTYWVNLVMAYDAY